MIAFLAAFLVAVAVVRAVFVVDDRRAAVVVTAVAAAVFVVDVAVFEAGGLVLEKTVGRAVLPLGLVFVAAWTNAAFTLGKKQRSRRALAVAIVVTVVGNEPLGQWAMDQLETAYQSSPFDAGSFDAVVVLGGGAQAAPGHDGGELGPSGDRILLGARLYYAGQTPLLVTTGTPIAGFLKPFDSLSTTTKMWRSIGIPADAIVPVEHTRTTREEADAVALLAKSRGWRRIGLLTSAWHLRRATRLFKKAGVDVVPLAADHRGDPTWEGLYSVVPVGNGAYLQQKAAWEWIGALVGR